MCCSCIASNGSSITSTFRCCNAKVDEAPALAVQHEEDVVWLDIPVHRPRAVHGIKALCQIMQHEQNCWERPVLSIS
jgi:hypothetical protein